ncbi:MAG: ComEA family DNA-binding protein [Anaerolineae bacterium]|nr:ComEA family DNA-binding protein [Anaerolineae bacterium]
MEAWLRKYRGYLALALVELAVLGAFWHLHRPGPAPIVISEPSPQPSRTPGHLVVYVSGAVERPDVYTLPEGSRLKDALVAAAGPRDDADLTTLNLAQPLHDGQRVHIPVLGETPLPEPTPPSAANPSPAQPRPGDALNINAASAAELDTLPGIGPVLAQRIVDDREANGPYTSVDDLERVRGIGPSLIEKLRPLISVQ